MRFPFDQDVKKIGEIFRENGFSLYLVGGAVRDFLLKSKIHDLDFATDAKTDDVKRMFRHTIDTGIKHGTVTILFRKKGYEVTTFRIDGKYNDNRHPESVEFVSSLEEDLKRRDFTINALAASVPDGKIIDLVGGKKDLKRKIIRAIGKAEERFSEDALRIMRAARFSSKLAFDIDGETFSAMKRLAQNITSVSKERVKEEFYALIAGKDPVKGLEAMRESGLLAILFPELAETIGVYQGGVHKYDVYTHLLLTLSYAVKNEHPFEVRMAALFHDVGKPETRREDTKGEREYTFYSHDKVSAAIFSQIARRLKTSNEEREKVAHLIENHMFAYDSSWTDSAVRRFLKRVGKENLNDLIDLRIDDEDAITGGRGDRSNLLALIERINEEEEKGLAIMLKDLAINGNDLKNEDIVPCGPEMGRILSLLLDEVIEMPSLNRREYLIRRAKELASRYSQ